MISFWCRGFWRQQKLFMRFCTDYCITAAAYKILAKHMSYFSAISIINKMHKEKHSMPQQALLVAFLLLLSLASATEFTYGSFSSDLKSCYSSSINSQSIRPTPVIRTFTSTPNKNQVSIMKEFLQKKWILFFSTDHRNGTIHSDHVTWLQPDLRANR